MDLLRQRRGSFAALRRSAVPKASRMGSTRATVTPDLVPLRPRDFPCVFELTAAPCLIWERWEGRIVTRTRSTTSAVSPVILNDREWRYARIHQRREWRRLSDRGTLGGRSSFGFGINFNGQMTGHSQRTSGINHAFPSGPTEVVARPSGRSEDEGAFGVAVNSQGQVVGRAETAVSRSMRF